MELRSAIEFLRPAVPSGSGTWADLGAGTGTFTEALAHLLGPAGTVIAVDQDASAVAALDGLVRPRPGRAAVTAVVGDVGDLPSIAVLRDVALDGALLANVLHYFEDPLPVLKAVRSQLVPGGRIVVLEYDGAAANPWVPFPVSIAGLGDLTTRAGWAPPTIVGRQPSRYQGTLYGAVISSSRPQGA